MGEFIHFNGQPLHYTDTGSGPAVILLHGFTESLLIWDDYAQLLSNNFRVICIDMPGHGRSANLSEVHSMDMMAEAVYAVLSKLGVLQCVMLGHSMGGYVALSFAQTYSVMLKGLVLFHSQAEADDEVAIASRNRAVALIKADRMGFLRQFITELFAPDNRQRLGAQIEVLKNQAGSLSSKGLIAALEGMKSRKCHKSLLGTFDFPVLFIAGKKDSRIPFEKVMEQAGLPKHSELLALNDVGHMGYLEASETVLEVIRDFCRRVLL